jgi:NAD(P)H-hydrate repair Nnr-like enzyme with NAD(P)H-hydrate epimerase domain
MISLLMVSVICCGRRWFVFVGTGNASVDSFTATCGLLSKYFNVFCFYLRVNSLLRRVYSLIETCELSFT